MVATPMIVEYASVIWSPYTNSNINTLEMVQQKAARFVFNDYPTYSSISNMLQELQWNSLQERKIQARLFMFYKIIHNLVKADFSSHFYPMGTVTMGRQLKFRQLPTRLGLFQQSFLPATIRDWNSLPRDIVTSLSLDKFTLNLKLLHAHTLIYEVLCRP